MTLYIVKWMIRILKPLRVLRKYLIPVTWMGIVTVLFLTTHIPVRIKCHINCYRDDVINDSSSSSESQLFLPDAKFKISENSDPSSGEKPKHTTISNNELIKNVSRQQFLRNLPARNQESRTHSTSAFPAKTSLRSTVYDDFSNKVVSPLELYYETERKKCAKQDSRSGNSGNKDGDDNVSFCSCIPNGLKGKIQPDLSSDFIIEELQESQHADVQPGGVWQPSACRARTRMAIIVPYRDRLEHLKLFLANMLPILKRQLIHFRIFVVEQNKPAFFNKAAMMNIGFLEAVKQFQFDCVVFHDVDILMEDDRALLNCGDTPHHYAISIDRWNYSLKYEAVFGAVISMRQEMFTRINGFSNFFFGWGGEDDDMGKRVRRYWKVFRPPAEIARYTAVKHKRDAANAVNKDRMKIMRRQGPRSSKDGINSIRYEVKKMENRALFTWILADLNVTGLPHPNYTAFNYASPSRHFCSTSEGITPRVQLSKVTCQYECDRLKSKCLGFIHESHERDWYSDCRLIKQTCTSLVVTHQRVPNTYLKLPITIPIKRQTTSELSSEND